MCRLTDWVYFVSGRCPIHAASCSLFAPVILAQKKVVVDPVKFSADLESYEDLKRRLVLDTASFGAVSALVAWQVRNWCAPRVAQSETLATSQ